MKKIIVLLLLCVLTIGVNAQIDSTIVDSTLTQLSELPNDTTFTKDDVIGMVEKIAAWGIEQAKNSPDTKNPMDWIGWGVAALFGLIALISQLFKKKKE